ncbi:MAG: phage major capsid protein [Gammaproteobacteria bacterium]|nr:phage major capsid protein [Gammaproteobacteria bacterium]MBU1647428.1 phage major capsid protein [Gammaproteobacteria bacterium]MBU1973220.1 phage major capsid protein [Gammaproteobacteria bacterium]
MFQRTATIEHRAAGDDGLVEIAISSEAPYERFFGIEVLRHTAAAIDMTRIGDGRHPLLLNHDTDAQIGAIKSARIDDDKVLRGRVQFSRSTLGQEIRQDVEDDIRSHVSVGYFIDEIEEVDAKGNPVRTLTGDEFTREMRETHGDDFYRSGLAAARAKGDTPPTFVVTRWTPFEASIVPVPADVTVGVGRSAGVETTPQASQQPAPLIIVEKRTMENLKTPAEIEIERRDGIMALAVQYAKYLGPNDGPDFTRSGKSVEAFKDFIIERIQSRHTDASVLEIGMSKAEKKRYSLGRAIAAAVTGDWSQAGLEREASDAVAKIMGRSAEGFYLPPEAFSRDFNVGTATEAGNLVATDLRTDMFVDALRNQLVMGQLGARILGGLTSNIDLPRKSTAATIGSVTEIGSASETAPATAKVTLQPRRASAFVEVSKQAIIQSAMSLEAMIRDDLVMSAAVTIEGNSFNGNGTAPQPTGLRYTTGMGTVVGGTNGAALAWSHLVDLESACANANAEPDRLAGYAINTRVRGKAKQTQFATNLPFIWQNGAQPLNGYRAAVSNNLPSNLTKGTSTTVCSAAVFGSDWSMATIGLFGAPDVTVDPYSKADTGQVKITLNQFYDFGVRQPSAFSKIDDIITG